MSRKSKNAMVRSYNKKYGIILSPDKVLNTYDIIQWYKWTVLELTPNGKYLARLPTSLITLNNIAKIVRYVINDVLNWRTREEILEFSIAIMTKYRIEFSNTDINGVKRSPFALLQLAYPDLNIQGWELSHAPQNYWNNYNNLLECVSYYYNTLNEDQRSNYLYFTDKSIGECLYKLLSIKKYKYPHLTWREIFGDAGYNIPKYGQYLTYDGNIMSSASEVLVYDFIHQELGLNSLKYVGLKRKHKYVYTNIGNGIDNAYCPDFYVEPNKQINSDRTLIVEYYGLFDINKKGDIFTNYIEKTIRKNKFYKMNPDIYLIDLYPQDLNNNLEGVRKKLTPFLL